MSMPIRDKILLLTEGYTTIVVNFPGSTNPYTYKAMIDECIIDGDAVVVNSPSKGLTVVTVTEVHATPQIDINSNFVYQWIVQKVDTTKYKKRKELEDRLAESLLQMERQKQREALAAEVRAAIGEDTMKQILSWTEASLK